MFLQANPLNSLFSKPGSVESLLYSDHDALTRLITLSLTSAKEKKRNKVCRFLREKALGLKGRKDIFVLWLRPLICVKSALSLDIWMCLFATKRCQLHEVVSLIAWRWGLTRRPDMPWVLNFPVPYSLMGFWKFRVSSVLSRPYYLTPGLPTLPRVCLCSEGSELTPSTGLYPEPPGSGRRGNWAHGNLLA